MDAEKRKTILLVEDEAITAMAEKAALEKYGYDVITALSGEEAVSLVEKTPVIDLILMDINLGKGIDGTEAAAIILKNHDLPIVFLSSHMEPDIVAKTERITSYGYVVKDSSITVLDASIKMAFKLFEAKLKEKEKTTELRENEQLLNFHVNNSPLATIELTSDFIVKRWSGEAEKLFGWNRSETMGKPLMDLKMIYDEDIPIVQQIMERLSRGSSQHIVSTNRNYTKAGKVIICEWYNSVLLDPQGKMISLMSQGIDITERKQAEATLRGSEERYKALFDRSLDLIYIHDFEGRFIDVNDAALNRLGYTREEIRGLNFTSLLSEDQVPLALKTLREIRETGFQKDLTEFRLRHKNGSQVHVETKGSAILSKGSFSAIQAIARDISERKRAEDMLQESETRYRELFDNMSSGVAVYEVVGNGSDFVFKDLNRAGERLDGARKEDVIGKSIFQIRPGIDKFGLLEVFRRVYATGIPEHHPAKFYQDEQLQGLYDNFVYRLPSGEIVAVYDDISERKQIEEKLKESRLLLESSIESPKDMIILSIDKQYRYLYFNAFHQVIMMHAYGQDVKLGMNLLECITNDDDRRKAKINYDRALTGESHTTIEEYGDLDHYYYETRYNPIVNDKNEVIGATAFSANVSERKQAEEEIKRQLAEKETLLKEVHHRIKNNIAAIGGLISLRMQSIANPEALAVLKEANSRVTGMRLLYDKLMLEENYKDISVKTYLEDLTDTIVALFPDQARIKLDRQIADFHLDAKQLFPLGSIINELLTNTMKYAFIDRKTGLIKISLTNVKKHVTLTVQDNGKGLPAGFDIDKAKGFGLMLVKMLSQQLGGSFSIKSHKGTRSTLEFDI